MCWVEAGHFSDYSFARVVGDFRWSMPVPLVNREPLFLIRYLWFVVHTRTQNIRRKNVTERDECDRARLGLAAQMKTQ